VKLLEEKSLHELWLNITEFLCLMTDFFVDDFQAINPILHNLQPMIESFFIIVKILHADEEMIYDPI